jgi:hypothetical protein
MQVVQDETTDNLAGNSLSKIPTFSRALSVPLLGSLILDAGVVYVGSGTAWTAVGGGGAPNVTMTSLTTTITNGVSSAPLEYANTSTSYFYSTMDNGTNQLHTLNITTEITQSSASSATVDMIITFPAAALPATLPLAGFTSYGIVYDGNLPATAYGSTLVAAANGSFVLTCVQVVLEGGIFTAYNTITWVV